IRDFHVTGVQTCALPISFCSVGCGDRQILAAAREGVSDIAEVAERIGRSPQPTLQKAKRLLPVAERSAPVDRVLPLLRKHLEDRSEERRVGQGCGSGWRS